MTSPTRWTARIVAAALLAALAAGCQESDPSAVTPADFRVRTKGSPEELWQYVGNLERKYAGASASDPVESREILSAFTTAEIGTLDAILAHPSADDALREKALKVEFHAYERRGTIDKDAEKELFASFDRIEAKYPGTNLTTLVCQRRTELLGQKAMSASEEERKARFEAVVQAALHTVSLVPPPPRSADVLAKLANDCEAFGFHDLAKKVESAIIEKFPDSSEALFAKGALHRHDLKGKVIDDLQGSNKDGKPISIKDYRGKVVVAVFWITSLEPSVNQVEEIDAFRSKYDAKDFQVLGIALDPDSEMATRFLECRKIAWPQIDSKIKNANLESEMNLKYGFKSLFYLMLIDREGKLVDYGYLFSKLRPELEKLLPPPHEPVRPEEPPAKPDGAKAK